MGQTRGQGGSGLEPLDLANLALQCQPLADIADHGDHLDRLAATEGTEGDLHRERVAVGVEGPERATQALVTGLRLRQVVGHQVCVPGPAGRGDQILHRHALQSRMTEQTDRRGVGEHRRFRVRSPSARHRGCSRTGWSAQAAFGLEDCLDLQFAVDLAQGGDGEGIGIAAVRRAGETLASRAARPESRRKTSRQLHSAASVSAWW
ncbi:MAG: hypothetical protein U5R48_16680 [Gammaproteobacteria bacterium]|nr:hypothetical protein [Gammaproteobacteria bacterium]